MVNKLCRRQRCLKKLIFPPQIYIQIHSNSVGEGGAEEKEEDKKVMIDLKVSTKLQINSQTAERKTFQNILGTNGPSNRHTVFYKGACMHLKTFKIP